jgi:hypothetical protein
MTKWLYYTATGLDTSKLDTYCRSHGSHGTKELHKTHAPPPTSLRPALLYRQSLISKDGLNIGNWDLLSISKTAHQECNLPAVDLVLGRAIDEPRVVLELLLDASLDELAQILYGESLAVGRTIQHLMNQIHLGIVVALVLVYIPTRQRNIMLDSTVRGKVHEVEILSPLDKLASLPAAKVVEKDIRVLDKSPDSCKCADGLLPIPNVRVLELKVGGDGKDRTEERTLTDVSQGRVEVFHVNLLSAALNVAMVGEGIDDGTGTSACGRRRLCELSLG